MGGAPGVEDEAAGQLPANYRRTTRSSDKSPHEAIRGTSGHTAPPWASVASLGPIAESDGGGKSGGIDEEFDNDADPSSHHPDPAQLRGRFRMNERLRAVIGSIVFLFVAPGIVAGLIPWGISGWRIGPPLLAFEPFRWLGVLLLLLGGVLLLETFSRFALRGLGTPAPIAPTKTLVVSGSYRFVRNPMYVAVVSLIFGQALVFGNLGVLVYGLVVWLTVHAFVLVYEEPTLGSAHGAQYDRYRRNVRRWIPRMTPWQD